MLGGMQSRRSVIRRWLGPVVLGLVLCCASAAQAQVDETER
jgi:hypothetical protein